jgi:hypothetical protein
MEEYYIIIIIIIIIIIGFRCSVKVWPILSSQNKSAPLFLITF